MVQLYLLLRFETLYVFKRSAISYPVIIRLACTKANSSSNFVARPPSLPPVGGVLLCYVSINFGGSLLVVRLSLCWGFPQAIGVACVLPSYSFALILLDPALAALRREERLYQYSCPTRR